ncbi:MAG: DUF4394 domain-containing protein [Armatimonadota bacterium]|nr:DUF4394 domain-containing protein [Armatimonadota bacterium]
MNYSVIKSKNQRLALRRTLSGRLVRLLSALTSFVLPTLCLLATSSVSAATLPTGFVESRIATGLANPSAMEVTPDGRVFVCEEGGTLRVIKDGVLLPTPFLAVTTDTTGERGLLGVAFDPNFASNQYAYVYYTATSPAAHNRVSRFTANGDLAVPGSEVVLLDLDNLGGAYHNGGAIHFGSDGKLYIAVGENGIPTNAQSMNTVFGKMLRLNADGTIPSDNPFYNTTSGNNRAIWALGLRNPFTFAIQPSTGRMFINDVGQSSWEEINDGIAGSNYGWSTCEGTCSTAGMRNPLYAYPHSGSTPSGCAIAGGTFYNPATAQFPSDYWGDYFFADLCSGWIYQRDLTSGAVTQFATGITQPVDLKVGPDGSLYYLTYGTGSVYQVRYTSSQAPFITAHPANQTASVGGSASFTVAASGTAPLGYQWQRNGANISGATAATYNISSVAAGDNGAQFRCVVTNAYGTATSNVATLTVTANQAPTATITAPTVGTLYNAGNTINYSGTGSDPEDGNLPASAFTWQVDFYHNDSGEHSHPFIAPTSGATGGSFTIPTTGETSVNMWYRISLTVRDAGGLTNTTFVDIHPRTAIITLQTNPAGLQVTLDGQPKTTPYSESSVVGMNHALGVVSPQTVNGVTYTFSSWSDGAAASHTIATPATNTTYTATYSDTNPPPTGSVTIYAVDSNRHLLTFSSATPGTITSDIALTGLQTSEVPIAIDFRPSNRQLYLVGHIYGTSGAASNIDRLYTVNTTTGAVTQVGTTPFTPSLYGGEYAADFSAVEDRLRVLSMADQNLRLNPDTGATSATDTALAYAAGDAHAGVSPNVVGLAYTNSVAGATSTTAYGIDSNQNTLVRLGSPNGSPTSPNSGQVFTIGALGVDAPNITGFDIAPDGTAFASLTTSGTTASQLYAINLNTGAATLLGTLGNNKALRDIAVAPSAASAGNPGTLQFGAATYSVNESGPVATITVTRSGGSVGAVGVRYATGNGTARYNEDYAPATALLSWADGETAAKTFTVPIINDTIGEVNETVNLALLNPSGGATLGTPNTAVLTILDDDSLPDLLIKQAAEPTSAYALNNVYQGNPSGAQIKEQRIDPGVGVIHQIRVENDGGSNRSFVVRATESGASGFTMTYRVGSTDITAAILGAGYTTPVLSPGAAVIINLTATPARNLAALSIRDSILRVFRDGSDSTTRDAVQARTIVQPTADLLLKLRDEPDSAFVLNNVYQPVPDGAQVREQGVAAGETLTYQVKVENDSPTGRSFVIKGIGATGDGWTIRYRSGPTDITGAVLGSGYTTMTLAPGASEILAVEVTPVSSLPAGRIKDVVLRAFLTSTDVTVRDAVRARTVVNP